MTKEKDDQNISKSGVDKEKFPKLAKATELAENYKIRAEKAEAESKKLKVEVPEEKETPIKPKEEDTPKKSEYSLQDIRALSDVHDDDVDEVVDYAKSKGITVAEAKKTTMIQSFLENTKGERKTADATNTGKGKQGSSKVSGKSLLRKAQETGEIPESDADQRIIRLRPA